MRVHSRKVRMEGSRPTGKIPLWRKPTMSSKGGIINVEEGVCIIVCDDVNHRLSLG